MAEKQTLESWKEIAAYLKRSVKTCQRLEQERGLPVHRLEDSPKARVFAHREEIDRWLENGRNSDQEALSRKSGLKSILIPALAVCTIVLVAVVIWLFALQNGNLSDSAVSTSPVSREPGYRQITYHGTTCEPALSPDGSLLAYTEKEQGEETKLMLRDLSGEEAVELYTEHTIEFPRWSPDGFSLAFVSGEPGQGAKLMLRDLSEDQAHTLLKENSIGRPGWSPDGSELLVTAIKNNSYGSTILVSRDGQSQHPIFNPVNTSSWSPDGSQIAMTRMEFPTLWLWDRATGTVQSFLVSGIRWLLNVNWAQQSDLILLSAMRNNNRYAIFTIRPDFSQLQKVVEETQILSPPRWSETGDTIYYFRRKDENLELVKITIDNATGKAKSAPSILLSDTGSIGNVAFSSDSTRLAFTRHLFHSKLWLTDFRDMKKNQAPQTKLLATCASKKINPVISPSGEWIAFSDSGNIFKMWINGGPGTSLTFSESVHNYPVWSPDEKWIACIASKGETRNILAIDPDGGASVRLATSNEELYGPVWSPDSGKLAYGTDEDGNGRIWIADINGGHPRVLAEIQWNLGHVLSWSPGRNILYQTAVNRNFMVLDMETGKQELLVDNIGYVSNPIYAPDREKVAITWNRRGNPGLWLVSLTDHSERLVAEENVFAVGWSPDGTKIYALHHYPGVQTFLFEDHVLVIPAEGGNSRTLFTLPGAITGVSISPDGQKFVCSTSESISDIWLIENFDPNP